MNKEDKERVVTELTDKLRSAETLFVADYRGLTMPQIDARIEQLGNQPAADSPSETTDSDPTTSQTDEDGLAQEEETDGSS